MYLTLSLCICTDQHNVIEVIQPMKVFWFTDIKLAQNDSMRILSKLDIIAFIVLEVACATYRKALIKSEV
jgi:hypothetical protein